MNVVYRTTKKGHRAYLVPIFLLIFAGYIEFAVYIPTSLLVLYPHLFVGEYQYLHPLLLVHIISYHIISYHILIFALLHSMIFA